MILFLRQIDNRNKFLNWNTIHNVLNERARI